MNLRLVVEQVRGRRQVLRVNQTDAFIGRASGSVVRIPSVEVSRRHCRLRQANGVVTVEDLDSANGTFVNGRAVSGMQLLRPGDTLAVGPVTFVVEYDLSDDALERFESSSVMEALDAIEAVEEVHEVKEVHEVEELEPVEELPLERIDNLDDLPIPMTEDDEEEAPPDRNIFNFDDSKWEMPAGGLRDILADMDDDEAEGKTDEK